MAYLGDPRESAWNQDGMIWEQDNRVEPRYYWNGSYIDYCGYDPAHIMENTYKIEGSTSGETGPFSIIFYDEDGTTVLGTTIASKNSMPVYTGETPTKASTAKYTYTFGGWVPSLVKATKDATYKAYYTSEVRSYPLIINGSAEAAIEYGETVSVAEITEAINPDFLNANRYTIEWSDAEGNPVALTDTFTMDESGITLTYTSAATPHTITINDYDGTNLENVTTGYNESVIYQATASVRAHYTFKCWNPTIPAKMPDHEMTVEPVYDPVSYTITFKNEDGTILSTAKIPYDTLPEYTGATPTKETDISYTYSFNGWDKTIEKVTGDTEYTAQYAATARQYTITFKNYDNTVLETKSMTAYTTPVYEGATPTKPEDAQYTYTFDAWDPVIAEVTGNAEYKATYTETVRSYDITFVLNNGEANVVKTYEYGEMPTCDDPSKASTEQFDYTFSAWNPAIVEVSGAKTYSAVYKEVLRHYNVIINGGRPTAYAYGTVIVLSDVVKELYGEEALDANKYIVTISDGTQEYSTGDTITLTGELTLTVTREATPHTISFYNEDGSVLKTINSSYGATIDSSEVPSVPTKEGYTGEWDNEVPTTCPASNLVIKPVYTINQYTITYYVDGVQDGNVETYNYGVAITIRAAKSKEGYTFSGWDKTLPATMPAENIVINGTFTINKYILTFNLDGALYSSAETEYNTVINKPTVTPDSGYTVSEWASDEEYTTMPAHDVTYTAETSKIPVTVEILTKTEQEDGTFITTTAKTDTAVTWGEVYTLDKPTYDETVYTFAWDVTEPWTPVWSTEKQVVTGTLSLIKEATTIYFGTAAYSDITGATDNPTMLSSLSTVEAIPDDGIFAAHVYMDSNYETNYNLYYNEEEWSDEEWANYIQSVSKDVVIIVPATIDLTEYAPYKRTDGGEPVTLTLNKSIKIDGADYNIWFEDHQEDIVGYNVYGFHGEPVNPDMNLSITLTVK